jgi:hypothetical protein
LAEPGWWKVYLQAKDGPEQHLDRAQLIKHYFGLREFRRTANGVPQITLLYIFWEPINWREFEQCKRHREEVDEFAAAVSSSAISFKWTTYNQLWDEWQLVPVLADHVKHLKDRYAVEL